MKTICWAGVWLLCVQSMFGDTNIVAPGATLKKLAGEFAFTEGPAADKDGNVFFTDQPNDRIMKWSVDGKLTTFMQPSGRANGLSFDEAGNLWACADGKNELWRISPDGKTVDVVLKDHEGKLFNGPNDLWLVPTREASSAQGLYFTDPFYKRNYWSRGPKEMTEGVYYLAPNWRKAVRVIEDMQQPNGIIGTPDGKTIYVADIKAGKTYRYQVEDDGKLTNKMLFCERGSDGLTIDNEGNVYTTSKGVFVFAPSGQQILHIEVPEPWTANVCFGGKDRQMLFITASKGIYAMDMRVKGVGSQ